MAEAQQVNVQEARTFLTSIGHNADAVTKMADPDVTKVYTQATGYLDKEFSPKRVAFGEKWREDLAADDPEALTTLGRFKTPKDLWARTKELTGKLSSGELKSTAPFPAKGTPEDQAAWRKERGIPDKPEAYDTKLDNGVVIGEVDKPIVDDFLKFAHANNMNPAEAKGMLQWYFGELVPGQQKVIAAQTKERQDATEKSLRDQWGPDYKRNMTATENMVARFFPADDEKNGNIRTRTMNAIKQDPAFAQVMATMALEIDPTTALTITTGHSDIGSIETRIAEIDTLMRNDRPAYNANEKVQAEYRELITARDAIKARGK